MVRANPLCGLSLLSAQLTGRLAHEAAEAIKVRIPGRVWLAFRHVEVTVSINESHLHAETLAQQREQVLAMPSRVGPRKLNGRTRTIF
jgi:hypothetical protein